MRLAAEHRLKLTPLIGLSLLFVGCRASGDQANATPAVIGTHTPAVIGTCTLEGCGSTLVVRFTGNVPPEYRLEASDASGEAVWVQCARQADGTMFATSGDPRSFCTADRVHLFGFAPSVVTVTVRWDGRSTSQTFQPAYRTSRPNGPGCEPECRSGTVTLSLNSS